MKKTWLKYFSILLAVILFSGCGGQTGGEQNSGQEKAAEPSAAEQKADQPTEAKSESGAAKNKGVTAPDFTLKDRTAMRFHSAACRAKRCI